MKYKINLLSEKEPSFAERVMYFFLNYLRYIIVITQLVVIGVFFYRFKVDQSIIDLKESVDQKREIIQVVSPLLNQAEAIDERTREIKQIIGSQKSLDLMINYLLSIFPQDINLTTLEVGNKSLKMVGKAPDSKVIQAFYQVLKRDKKFTKIDLQNIKRTEEGYSLVLNLTGFVGN